MIHQTYIREATGRMLNAILAIADMRERDTKDRIHLALLAQIDNGFDPNALNNVHATILGQTELFRRRSDVTPHPPPLFSTVHVHHVCCCTTQVFQDKYKSTVEWFLVFKDSREDYIRRSLIRGFPVLARYDLVTFSKEYFDTTLAYLLRRIGREKGFESECKHIVSYVVVYLMSPPCSPCWTVFSVIGELVELVGSSASEYSNTIASHINAKLQSSM